MDDRRRAVLKVLLRLLVTVALLGTVLHGLDGKELWRAALGVEVRYLFVVFALYVFSFWVRSYRFHFILKVLDCSVSTVKIFFASAITMLYSLVLPGAVSTGVKWYILKEHTGKASRVLSCMAYNQISEMTIKVLIGLLAIAWVNPGSKNSAPLICGAAVLFVVLSCVLLLNAVTGPPVNRAFNALFRPFPALIRKHAGTILGQIECFQTAGWRFHAKMIGICLFASLVGIAIYFYSAEAVGISVPLPALAWQCSVIFVLSRLPITLANLGLRERALVEFLAVYGIAKSDAFMMSMVIFSGVLLMAAIGAVCQLSGPFKKNDTSPKNKV